MEPTLYIIVVVLVVGLGATIYMLFDLKRNSGKPIDNEPMKLMMEWMKEIKQDTEASRQTMDKNLSETNKQINERLDKAAQVIGGVMKELGSMSQIGPDIRRLSETLSSSKMRGNFGEEMLENMLGQVLPKSGYHVQHKFKNGEVVDAIVLVGENKLCIDSKFSMENFRLYREHDGDAADTFKKSFMKDVKKRLDEIHKKYILPQEGTFDFALMYVPSEGIYQEIILDDIVMEYARKQRVIPVSPNSLFVYLQNVVVSLRGQQVNKIAKEIVHMIAGIKQESDKFGKNLDVLSSHIKNAGNTMGTVSNDFLKLKSSISNAATLELDETESEPEKVIKIETTE